MWAERTPSNDGTKSKDQPPVFTPKLVLGFLVLIAGILLTLDSVGLVDSSRILRYWPAGLIALGLVMVVHARDGNGRGGGVVIILVGGLLLLNTLNVTEVRFWELFWPAVMVVAGVNLIMQTMRRHRAAPLDPNDTVSMFAMMGGVKRTSNAARFRHSDLASVWGGCDLDLRQATIPPGEEASLDVFAMMGGHKIRVPEEWVVDTRVFPFMGGVDDKTKPPKDAAAPRLVVRGAVIMGGVHIEN